MDVPRNELHWSVLRRIATGESPVTSRGSWLVNSTVYALRNQRVRMSRPGNRESRQQASVRRREAAPHLATGLLLKRGGQAAARQEHGTTLRRRNVAVCSGTRQPLIGALAVQADSTDRPDHPLTVETKGLSWEGQLPSPTTDVRRPPRRSEGR